MFNCNASEMPILVSNMQIREAPQRGHHRFIEFYDVRAAEAALHALNRSDIAGKKIKLEPSPPVGARRWYCPISLATFFFLFLISIYSSPPTVWCIFLLVLYIPNHIVQKLILSLWFSIRSHKFYWVDLSIAHLHIMLLSSACHR